MRTFLLAALAALAPCALRAQDKLTPRDIFEFEFPGDPQISPDGQWIAWERRSSDIMTDKRYSTIWIVKSDGTEQRPLTTGKVNDVSPRWSPDGTRLAYISSAGGTPQIVVRWMASGQVQTITNVAEPPLSLAWSPDGKQIAFMKLAPEAPLVIGTPGTPPPGATWAPPPKYTDKLVFRFDGLGELPPGYTHLFVVPSEGGTVRQLTTGNFNDSGRSGSMDIAWAPDGKAIVIASRRRPDWETNMLESDLYEVSLADGGMKQLTDRFGPDNSPAISPDGKLIAWTGFDDRKQGYQNTQLWIMNRDGTGKRVLSTKLDQSVAQPLWAADGRGVYVWWSQHGNTKVGLFALDGSYRIVASDVGAGGSAYSIGGTYSVARDGSVAWPYTRPDFPGEVAVMRPSQPMKVVTAINADLVATRKLGKVDSLWWESAKDQRKIQGWVITPPDFDPGRKYPLILEIHGGPFADYGDRFDIEKQLMAAAGYVVLYANPRGSTSYGEEFGNLIHHAYPGDDFYDLNSGVDAVIAKGYIDEKRLYVTGGSGGGVLTAWMIGNTDRFRAALAFYPVINWESFVLTADMSAMGVNNWFPGLPWDHRDNYDKRSLLSVVKNVKTPTLIMTGEEDYRTPMSESEQYYKALKMLGVQTVLVRVPGEPHGIRVRPSHAMSKLTTLAGWFEKFQPAVP